MLLHQTQWYKYGESISSFGQEPSTKPSLFFAERAMVIALFHGPKPVPLNTYDTRIVPGFSETFKYKGLEASFIAEFLAEMFS